MNNKLTAADAMRRLEELAAEISGKKADPSAEAKKKAAAYNVAFWENMHTGIPHNDLNVGSDGSGGYLVPDTYNDTLLEGLTEKNVIRQIARVIPTTHRMHIPVSNGIGDATWVIEGEPWSFDEASFGEVILDAYKLATTIRASDEMLEDGGVDLEVFLRDLYVKRIADAEERAFIRGDGNGKPLGLIYQADVGVISETEGDISVDDLISLEHSVPQSYRDKAVWLMSDDAYRRLRCIIHYDGNPLWDDPLEDGGMIRLLNHPVYICKAMDDVAPGNIPVMFRKLKEKGVEVYFEKENIYTLDSKGELLITIMSSLAQEESRSISENVTWGQRKRFADGKVSMAYKQFLGYRKGPDGLPEIDPEQAEVVRKIYRLFMAGKTIGYICKLLESEGIPTPGGKTKWQSQTVNSILTNEKYKGSALLQKTYTVDFLTKTTKVNEGEVPQYYVECSHPAIIDPAEWEAVQVEVARRKKLGRRHDCFTPFSGKVICGDCGGVYGSKIWHSNSKYRRVIWQCNRKFKNETKCTTPHVDEEILKEHFLQAVSEYMADPEDRIEGLRAVHRTMSCTDFIDADIEEKEAELELLSGMIRNCVTMNASASLTEQEYQAQYTELSQRYDSTKAGYEALLDRRKQMEATAIVFSGILFRLAELPQIPMEFNETLWHTLVDHVTVYSDERIVFTFTDGTEIVTML